MSEVLEHIKKAEKGSDIYHLIEEIAEKISIEKPGRKDEENWFEAQRKINDFLLEDKLAEKISLNNPEKKYDDCVEDAREILKKINLDKELLEEIASEGIPLNTLISCNLKYYSNQFYLHRRNKTNSNNLEKTFDDWKKALDCVADNIFLY